MNHIPIAKPSFTEKETEYVLDCIQSGWISSKGEYLEKFEKKFSEYLGVKNTVSCSNGTTALHLALKTLGIKEKDEVIIPNITFIATANAVSYCGAKPVLVDVEKDTWNLDPNKVAEKINKNTKAIIPVHLYGHSCDMDPIMDIAKQKNIFVIEDAAEAHGAEYKNKKVGSIGDIGIFSFYGNKIITTGEGGAIVTNNNEISEKAKFLGSQAMDSNQKYWHSEIGFNYRMTNVQAAIGLAQLENIDYHVSRHRNIAKQYSKNLEDLKCVILPVEKDYAKHVYWMYNILIDSGFKINRNKLMEKLEKNNVESRPMFPCLSSLPPYKSQDTFEVSNRISTLGINLPTFSDMSKEQITRVCDVIKD